MTRRPIEGITDSIRKEAQQPQRQRNFKEITPENVGEVMARLKIQLDKDYPEPPACITIGENRFATFGNFSTVIGKAKSRKTFLVSLLLSQCLQTDSQVISVDLPDGKKRVVYADTEQANYDVVKVARRIAGNRAANFDAYVLRSLKPKDRIKIIEQIIDTTPDLGILVIDGIRDLVNDINSPEEATEIASLLLRLTEEKQIHIITVLHQNKTDNNARGHLGTEVINKAETVISVEKDGDISIVSPEYCRGKDFAQFAFGINESGHAYILDDWERNNDTNGKKRPSITPLDIAESTHKQYLRSIFTQNKYYPWKDLVSALKLALDRDGCKIGDNKCRDFIHHYLNQDWIHKDKIGGRAQVGYYLKLPC